MADLDVSMAPGCFGISLLYRQGSNECDTCPFAAQCGPLARLQLQKLRAELGITVKMTKLANAANPTASGRVFSGKLPVKVQELVDAIERAGVKVCEALGQGVNPFTPKFSFLRVICHMLIRRQGAGITRDEAAQGLMAALKISRGAADAYCLQGIQALRAIGAADEVSGVVRIRA